MPRRQTPLPHILLGGLLGLLFAGLIYLLQRRAYRRRLGMATSTGLGRLRLVLQVVIALVVGVAVGYNCAMPTSTAGLLVTQVMVFLGGVAIAFVELGKTPAPPPPPLPAQQAH